MISEFSGWSPDTSFVVTALLEDLFVLDPMMELIWSCALTGARGKIPPNVARLK